MKETHKFQLNYINSNNIISLFDTEEWLFQFYLNEEYGRVTTSWILSLLETYINKAKSRYTNNELGRSRMILFCLVSIVILDKMSIEKHRILSEHKIGFETEIFEYLLIPNKAEIDIVQSLKNYVDVRNRSRYSSLIDPNIDSNWFGCRFAKNDQDMMNTKEEIRRFAENEKTKKLIELGEERRKYDDKMAESRRLSCNCGRYESFGRSYKKHCEKHYLEQVANSMTFDIYEWPLPELDFKKNAVVFELRIPKEIANLRDAIFILYNHVLEIENKKNCWKNNWLEYDQIEKWKCGNQKFLTLGSRTKLFRDSHYERPHVYSSDESFVTPNGYTTDLVEMNLTKCVDFDKDKNGKKFDKISIYQKMCTFKTDGNTIFIFFIYNFKI